MSQTEWVDGAAGPVVRPYAMVRGRTQARHDLFDLVAFVVAVGDGLPGWSDTEPEHLAILAICQRPCSVAEIAGRLRLPVGVVRVLLGDLLGLGAIRMSRPDGAGRRPSLQTMREVLDGLRAL